MGPHGSSDRKLAARSFAWYSAATPINQNMSFILRVFASYFLSMMRLKPISVVVEK